MSRANVVRLLALAGIWGSSFLLIKLALGGLSPMQIVFGRLLSGTAILVAALVATRTSPPRDPRVWGHLTVLSIIANVVPFFLFGWGEERITSGLAGVLNGTTPLFTLAIAVAALSEERLTGGRAAGLLLGFLGVVLVVGPWNQNPLTSSLTGQLACLGAAACYGLAFVYTRRYLSQRGHALLALAAGQLGMATLVSALALPLFGGQPVELTLTVAGSVLALGAVGTGLAYLLYYRLIEEAGATTASMVTYVIPVVAVVLGVLLLSEPLRWNLFVGAAVVILGVAVAEGRLDRWSPLPPARPRPAPSQPAPPAPAAQVPVARTTRASRKARR